MWKILILLLLVLSLSLLLVKCKGYHNKKDKEISEQEYEWGVAVNTPIMKPTTEEELY